MRSSGVTNSRELLVAHRRVVSRGPELESPRVEVVAADLPGADVAAAAASPGDLALGELPEVRELVARHDVVGRDVPDHTRDAAVTGNPLQRSGEHGEQLVVLVGAPLPRSWKCISSALSIRLHG